MTIFVICNCLLDKATPDQTPYPKMLVKLEVSTLVMSTLHNNEHEEPTTSYKWTGWVWEIAGSKSRVQEHYWSF